MAVFQRIPPDELRARFRYRGWLFGLVPVYVGPLDVPGPAVAVRNGVPERTLDAAHVLWSLTSVIADAVNPHREDPGLPIRITGRLDGQSIRPGELD